MVSFQAKTRQDKPRVIQKKKVIIPIHSKPAQNREFQKNNKKNQKIKKHHYGFIRSKKGTGQAKSDTKKKVIISIHSNPTRNREFQKNSKEMQKIKKQHCGFISSQNGMGQAESDTKKKK